MFYSHALAVEFKYIRFKGIKMKKLNSGACGSLRTVLFLILGILTIEPDRLHAGEIEVASALDGYTIAGHSADGMVFIGEKDAKHYRIFADGSKLVAELEIPIFVGFDNGNNSKNQTSIKAINAISNNGTTVFGVAEGFGVQYHYYWKESGTELKSKKDSNVLSQSIACNGTGEYYFSTEKNKLSVYSAGSKVKDLQVANIAGSSIYLSSISKTGNLIVGNSTIGGVKKAVFWNNWKSNNQAIALSSHLVSKNINIPSTTTLVSSHYISKNENYLAGEAYSSSKGKKLAYIASMGFGSKKADIAYIDEVKTWDVQTKALGSNTSLGAIPTGGSEAGNITIKGVSADGNIAVGNWEHSTVTGENYGFIWFKNKEISLNDGTTQIGFAMKFDDYLKMEDIALANGKTFEITKILGLTEDGNYITCQGTLDGNYTTFEVAVPEPASMTILLTASLALLRKRRKKKAC